MAEGTERERGRGREERDKAKGCHACADCWHTAPEGTVSVARLFVSGKAVNNVVTTK